MDQLNYDSNGDDDCSVEDVEFEADHYDDHDADLPEVSDLEFIAANAAEAFEFVDTGASMLEQDILQNESSSRGSDEDSVSESEDGMVETTFVADDCSSESSSDSEDEIVTDKQYLKKAKQISWLTEEEEEATTGPLKTKNELEEVIEVVEVKQLDINDSSDLVCVGEVKYRIDHECVVVIQADYTTNALNEGSVLCNIDGKILGKIQEIFGPITTPFYTVRWKNPSVQGSNNGNQSKKNNNSRNNKKKNKSDNKATSTATEDVVVTVEPIVSDAVGIEIENDDSLEQQTKQKELPSEETMAALDTTSTAAAATPVVTDVAPKPAAGLEISEVRALFPVGAKLYTVRAHCSFVLAAQLEKARAKGSDASNAYDEEPPEEEMEYSDDEKEMEAKLARKQAKKGQNAADAANFGDAIPPGTRFGANKRNLQGGRPNAARSTGAGNNVAAGVGAAPFQQQQQHQYPPQPQQGFYQQQPGGPQPPQAYSGVPPAYGMNQGYMGAAYMPQQTYYGQPQMQMQPPMAYGMPYGVPGPAGYSMQQYAPNMHAYSAQQPMYPSQPQHQHQQYAPQPSFLPAAAFVSGAYVQQSQQQGQPQGQQQPPLPQYQYQPLQYNNNSGSAKK